MNFHLLPLENLHSHSASLFVTLPTHQNLHHSRCHLFPLLPKPNHLSPLLLCRRSTNWDPSFRSSKTKYTHENDEDEDEDEEEGDASSAQGVDQWAQVLEDYIDSIWIFKVFGAYGWSLPFIILSILLATGLKAFLMALALPLGQSTISFFFQKISGSKEYRPKRKTKRKSRGKSWRSFTGKRSRKEKMGYPSWVPGPDVSADKGDEGRSFGGWDELDRGRDSSRGSPTTSESGEGRSRQTPPEMEKFTRFDKSDKPLLLRLLISVFPFLGWWTKMFY